MPPRFFQKTSRPSIGFGSQALDWGFAILVPAEVFFLFCLYDLGVAGQELWPLCHHSQYEVSWIVWFESTELLCNGCCLGRYQPATPQYHGLVKRGHCRRKGKDECIAFEATLKLYSGLSVALLKNHFAVFSTWDKCTLLKFFSIIWGAM